jgi:hypothetical protein
MYTTYIYILYMGCIDYFCALIPSCHAMWTRDYLYNIDLKEFKRINNMLEVYHLYLTPQYNLNTAKFGAKHQSTNLINLALIKLCNLLYLIVASIKLVIYLVLTIETVGNTFNLITIIYMLHHFLFIYQEWGHVRDHT